MELTPIQKEILTSLVTLYREKKHAVKGEEIAEMISRNPGTVRNQMQSLKALRLVEGVPGPKGGYKTTSGTYEVLRIGEYDGEIAVPIRRNGRLVEGVTALDINFTSLRHPDLCNGVVRVIGDIREFDIGDKIQVGPTPVNKLILSGVVAGRDDTENAVVFSVEEMLSLPKRSVKEYVKRGVISVGLNVSIQEASRVMVRNNIHGVLVENKDEIVGMVTFMDIGKAFANGKIGVKVKDIMSKDVVSIEANKPFYEIVELFNSKNVGRIVVTDGGRPIGVVSKTDVLHALSLYNQ
ncbi:hypothetical protein DRN70_03435 [Methanosarcinales archaeon]|nr:MAG: hypothetical protein DRN70_03435 [Methanosarcinales archaeon]